jgi:chaperonin GroEL
VVTKNNLRPVQEATLDKLSEVLASSFGPYGSFTGITKDKMEPIYTKDGHTILSHIYFQNQLERAIKDDIENITRHIVKTVGDGTTSAVILSANIFKNLTELDSKNYTSSEIISSFKKVIEEAQELIRSDGRQATMEDIYNIALIATNNNVEVAKEISDIYNEFGLDVFIDVSVSTSETSQLKIYDGMTIETGYVDTWCINDIKEGTATIRAPRIYIFEDPIDTPNMAALFDTIIGNNIIKPYNDGTYETVVPTVIMAPKISPDMSNIMKDLAIWIYKIDPANKPPILIISNIYDGDQLSDIAQLCGGKVIKKYLDPKIQEMDIQKGLAPDLSNVVDFYGTADEVVSDAYTTKIINPKFMYNEDGSKSDTFKSIITFLEAELEKAKRDGQDANVTGNLKRRINSLKANMVEYLIGGIATSDRDSLRAAVEDAVLNCRSAAANGVGYGANFEGYRCFRDINRKYTTDLNTEKCILDVEIASIILNSYEELIKVLYSKEKLNDKEFETLLESPTPYNMITKEYDQKVLSSIESDATILGAIGEIVTVMFTANQFILETPLHNVYGLDK